MLFERLRTRGDLIRWHSTNTTNCGTWGCTAHTNPIALSEMPKYLHECLKPFVTHIGARISGGIALQSFSLALSSTVLGSICGRRGASLARSCAESRSSMVCCRASHINSLITYPSTGDTDVQTQQKIFQLLGTPTEESWPVRARNTQIKNALQENTHRV
jgi:hypothetical protein